MTATNSLPPQSRNGSIVVIAAELVGPFGTWSTWLTFPCRVWGSTNRQLDRGQTNTHRQTHAHRNTPLPYRGGAINGATCQFADGFVVPPVEVAIGVFEFGDEVHQNMELQLVVDRHVAPVVAACKQMISSVFNDLKLKLKTRYIRVTVT